MSEVNTWVGMDVHKETIQVAMLTGSSSKPSEFGVGTSVDGIRRLKRQLGRVGVSGVMCAYEAGPSGFALQRQLLAAGIACQVVAPSKMLHKPGDRVKTDRRDACKLAEHLRAGLLTEVRPPSEAEESVRDLCRGREALILDNQVQAVLSDADVVHYAPVFSINESHWWIHLPPS